MNKLRKYKDENDMHAMCDLLMAGRKANNGSYYVHPGDLKWWLYYPPLEGAFWDHIYLWDDPNQPGKLMGWVMISPDWVGIDVYVQPDVWGSAQAIEMYMWAEEQAVSVARLNGKTTIHVLWISHQDDFLGDHFSHRGFKLKKGLIHLTNNEFDECVNALEKGILLNNTNASLNKDMKRIIDEVRLREAIAPKRAIDDATPKGKNSQVNNVLLAAYKNDKDEKQ